MRRNNPLGKTLDCSNSVSLCNNFLPWIFTISTWCFKVENQKQIQYQIQTRGVDALHLPCSLCPPNDSKPRDFLLRFNGLFTLDYCQSTASPALVQNFCQCKQGLKSFKNDRKLQTSKQKSSLRNVSNYSSEKQVHGLKKMTSHKILTIFYS